MPGCGEEVGAVPGDKGCDGGIISIIRAPLVPTAAVIARGSGMSSGSIRHGSLDT